MDILHIQEKNVNKMLILVLILFSNIYAALPPFFQSTEELTAILKDPKLHKELGSSETILEIKKDENFYNIYTKKYLVKVEVVYMPTNKIGKQKFRLEFNKKKFYLR